jgi:hypothetical protein
VAFPEAVLDLASNGDAERVSASVTRVACVGAGPAQGSFDQEEI